MPKLTKRYIDSLRPSSEKQDVVIWDSGTGSITGFGLRIKASGAMSYLIQYRNNEGRSRRMTLGRANTLTPETARQLAIKRLSEVAGGIDPAAERNKLRSGMTVKELCLLYLEESQGTIKASTLTQDKSRIYSHVIPLLGSRRIGSLTPSDLIKMQHDIANGRTAKARGESGRGGERRGGRGAAARTLGMLGTILETAKLRRAIEINPARGIKKFADNSRKRPLTTTEIVAFGKAVAELQAAGDNAKGLNALLALVLTGCRRNEILSLPWEWLDAPGRCIRFGDTKTGAQLRPLGAAAVNHLTWQSHTQESRWVFPADIGNGHFIGLPKVFERVCKKAGITGLKIHDLRHTFASVAAELNFSELTIAGLLGQKIKGVTARYAHVPDTSLLSAADKVANRIEQLLAGNNENAVILPFKEVSNA